jgi:hypothetical protein
MIIWNIKLGLEAFTMLDLNEMLRRQQDGLREIDSLGGIEMDILKHYCSLATEELLKAGANQKAPVDEVVINALRTGIALGIQLTIKNGEVQGREEK